MISFFDFANKNVGSSYDFSKKNCEHLVLSGLSQIYGVNVNILTIDEFEKCEIKDAQIFACSDSDGVFCHVGLVKGDSHLHAVGNPHSVYGQVYLHEKPFFDKVFKPKYESVEYFKCRQLM